MTSLRRAILLLVIFLAFFFNIERLDYGDQTLIDLHTFVYVLVTVMIVATLFFRPLQKFSTYIGMAIWLGMYLALKLTFYNSRPLFGGVYTYLSITEMAMIVIAILLTMNLSRSLNSMEGLAAKTILPRNNHRIKDLHEAEEDVKTEFIRSRRHNRPLSVVIIEMDQVSMKKGAEQSLMNVEQMMMNRFVLANLGQTLMKVVRRTDVILEPDARDGFILLCPETTEEGVNELANRIRAMSQKDLGLTVQCGTASFPEEATTFEDLIQKARTDLLEPVDASQVTLSKTSVVG